MNAKKERNGSMARMVVGTLLPAPMGVLFIIFFNVLMSSSILGANGFVDVVTSFVMVVDALASFILITAVAYVFIGVQSLIYALFMERLILPRSNAWFVSVGISALLGVVAGMSLDFFFALMTDALFMWLGLAVGFMCGWILHVMYHRQQN